MSGGRYIKTCRHCLGGGCIHCNRRGSVRERVFNRRHLDKQAVAVLHWLKMDGRPNTVTG